VAGSLPAGGLIAATIASSEAAAGLAQTAGTLGAAIIALPLARIALSRGRRAALGVGYAIGAAGAATVIAGAIGRSLPVVLAGCLLVGVASAASFQARYAATDLALPEHRARALSYVVWAGTVGAVLGPNLLGLSNALGLGLGLPELSGAYLVAGVALVVASMLIWMLLRPDPYLLSRAAADEQANAKPRLRDGFAHLRGRPRAMLGIGIIAVGHLVMVMVMVVTPIHMRHVDVSLQFIGLVISVHVAGMYAFSPLVGMAVDRIGRIQVAAAGIAILAAACIVSGLAPADDIVMLGIGLFLLGLGWSCTLISGSTLLTDQIDPADRPPVQGLSDLIMNAAGAVGGVAAGVILLAGSYGLLCALALIPLALLAAAVGSPACRGYSNTRSM
jgi:MFS family permease